MKRKLVTFALALGVSGLAGCAMATSPVTGFLYTNVKGPLTATPNPRGAKVGTASATSILGWIGTGDASIETAAAAAGITHISHVDYTTTNILGLYAKITTTVYGN